MPRTYAISYSNVGTVCAGSRERESRRHYVVAQRPLMAAGYLEHDDTVRGIRLFAREVLPALQEFRTA